MIDHPCLHTRQPNSILDPSSTLKTHLCLCLGFFEQMIYTYLPFFLLTLLHPSHSFLTELRTFMPLVCCTSPDAGAGAPIRSPAIRVSRLGVGAWLHASVGRAAEINVWSERMGRAKSVRRLGRRRARASISASG